MLSEVSSQCKSAKVALIDPVLVITYVEQWIFWSGCLGALGYHIMEIMCLCRDSESLAHSYYSYYCFRLESLNVRCI